MPLPLTDPRPAPPNRTVRLVYQGHFEEAPWVNVMWLYLTGAGTITGTDLNNLATSCYTIYENSLLQRTSEDNVLDACIANLYFDGDLVLGEHSGAAVGLGVTGVNLPANVAVGISWLIKSHYRGGHPRTYVCGLRSVQLSGTTSLAAAQPGFFADSANDMHTALEALGPIGDGIDTVEHGIVSFQSNKQWRTPPLFRRITGATCDTRIDTQRRRLGRDR